MSITELQCNRWSAEPFVLGNQIADAWGLIFYAYDLKTFACGACLLRLIPDEALWPIARALLTDFNTAQTLRACGYPKAPTPSFDLVLLALAKRNPVTLQPYIEGRIRACCGKAPAAWFLRNVTGAQAAKISAPLGVQKRSKKRKVGSM